MNFPLPSVSTSSLALFLPPSCVSSSPGGGISDLFGSSDCEYPEHQGQAVSSPCDASFVMLSNAQESTSISAPGFTGTSGEVLEDPLGLLGAGGIWVFKRANHLFSINSGTRIFFDF